MSPANVVFVSAEVLRNEGAVLGVLRVAVAGHEDAQCVLREGPLGEAGHDGGVDAAGDAEHDAPAAAADHLVADPGGEVICEGEHRSRPVCRLLYSLRASRDTA